MASAACHQPSWPLAASRGGADAGLQNDVATKGGKMTNQNLETTRRSAARKLHPSVIGTSTFVRSLLGCLLGEVWTDPPILDLRCGSDGMLLAYEPDSTTHLRVLCSRNELIRAVLYLAYSVDLTAAERTYLLLRVPPRSRKR